MFQISLASISRLLVVATTVAMLGCGGGGGGGVGVPTTPPAAVASAPTVAATISTAKASVNSTVTVAWSSTDATGCSIPELSKSSLEPKGVLTLTPEVGGQFAYTVQCSGAGGSANKTLSLVVPMPVYKTSYENKNMILLDNPKIPPMAEIVNLTPEAGELGFSPRSVAFADFAQEGGLTAVTVSQVYKNVYQGSNAERWPDSPGKVYFLRKDATGNWSDISDLLIKASASRYTCVSPGFVEVADLNNDGKPDVLIGCTGIDFMLDGVWTDDQLSDQYVLLSQSDGMYAVSKLGIKVYGHQTALGDIDGDGNVDVIATDTAGQQKPFVMWGNGDGTFSLPDYTRFPADVSNVSIYSLRVIPIGGEINVVLSGYPLGSGVDPGYAYGTKVLQYKNGSFRYTQDLTSTIPTVSASGLKYGLPLDVIHEGGNWYALRVSIDYSSSAIIRTDIAGVSKILVERVMSKGGPGGSIKLTSDGKVVNQMANCGSRSSTPTDWFYYECTLGVAK